MLTFLFTGLHVLYWLYWADVIKIKSVLQLVMYLPPITRLQNPCCSFRDNMFTWLNGYHSSLCVVFLHFVQRKHYNYWLICCRNIWRFLVGCALSDRFGILWLGDAWVGATHWDPASACILVRKWRTCMSCYRRELLYSEIWFQCCGTGPWDSRWAHRGWCWRRFYCEFLTAWNQMWLNTVCFSKKNLSVRRPNTYSSSSHREI